MPCVHCGLVAASCASRAPTFLITCGEEGGVWGFIYALCVCVCVRACVYACM
jgi:hypothetical protein